MWQQTAKVINADTALLPVNEKLLGAGNAWNLLMMLWLGTSSDVIAMDSSDVIAMDSSDVIGWLQNVILNFSGL